MTARSAEATDTPVTLEVIRKGRDVLDRWRWTQNRVVSPQLWEWLVDHHVLESEATHILWGIPVRIDDE